MSQAAFSVFQEAQEDAFVSFCCLKLYSAFLSFWVLSMIRKEAGFMEHWIHSRDPTWQSIVWQTHHPSLRNPSTWCINSTVIESFLRSNKRVNVSGVSFFAFWLVSQDSLPS